MTSITAHKRDVRAWIPIVTGLVAIVVVVVPGMPELSQGLAHVTAAASCPCASCLDHFVALADGVTPVYPYQVAGGPTGGPQVLDGPATDIEWNALGDGQPHTLVIEAVDQLGPVPAG